MIAFLYASTLPIALSEGGAALVTVPLASIPAVLLVLRAAFSARSTWAALLLAAFCALPIGYLTNVVAAVATLDGNNVFGAVLFGLFYGPVSGLFLMATFAPLVLHARSLERTKPVDASARTQLLWGGYVAAGAAILLALLANGSVNSGRAHVSTGWLCLLPTLVLVTASSMAVVGAWRTLQLRAFVRRVAKGDVPHLQLVSARDIAAATFQALPRTHIRGKPQHAIALRTESGPYRASPPTFLVAV